MSEGPVRRGELIAPTGVGAMSISPDGVSVIIAGLDHWYPPSTQDSFDVEEFKVFDLRLQLKLQCSHFRLPPDFRRSLNSRGPNELLNVPVLRFPETHVCTHCRILSEYGGENCSRIRCPKCKVGFLEQVPLVTVCERGHLQDFPWRAWVHSKNGKYGCTGDLKLKKSGTLGLGAQYVSCEACKAGRSLSAALTSLESILTNAPTDDPSGNHCRGARPWLGGYGSSSECGAPIQAVMRTAGNVYFSSQDSALFLPDAQDEDEIIQELKKLLDDDDELAARAQIAKDIGADPIQVLTYFKPEILRKYDIDHLRQALGCVSTLESGPVTKDQWLSTIRGREYQTLATNKKYPAEGSSDFHVLRIEPQVPAPDSGLISECFSKINLIHRLRETRVMSGFTRFKSANAVELSERKKMLWTKAVQPWLPATVVFGEGIFLEFDMEALKKWKDRAGSELVHRIDRLQAAHDRTVTEGRNSPRQLTPEFLLVHTLSHLLINRLVYECGYQAAALRERLYLQPGGGAAALLVYTADGDSEGTLGGLVRLGKPEKLEAILQRAINGAQWCSSDPVCQEVGSHGQGPDSLNLAACHSCAMVPETCCEAFNKYLDRGLVIGTQENPDLGYFKDFV
jgi:hypothetical protein